MGDMYGMVMGDGKEQDRFRLFAEVLFNILREDVGRFRDCWIEGEPDGRMVLAIYTRNGGGNRPDFVQHSEHLATHPCFVDDEDDAFDSTYRTYRFRVPDTVPPHLEGVWNQEQWHEALTLLVDHAEPRRDMSARWKAAIARMEAGEFTPKQTAAVDQLGASLRDALDPSRKPGDGPTIINL